MSNETIAERLLEVTDGVHCGALPSSAFADAVEAHAPAFEGMSRKWLDHLNRLSVQVIEEDVSPLEEEMLGIRNSRKSLQEAVGMLRAVCATAQQSVQPDRREDAAPG